LAALSQCPACQLSTQVLLFPAYDRPAPAGAPAQKVVMEGEAACFYHPNHRAYVPCDACGRFLCALCDLELQGRHLCPACLETASKKGNVQSLERNRTRWDQIVLLVLLVPLPCCYILVPFTSLAGLGLIIWKWKSASSLVSNTRLRMIIYAFVAVVEFAVGSIIWYMGFLQPHQ
jgi:hypothetical protein